MKRQTYTFTFEGNISERHWVRTTLTFAWHPAVFGKKYQRFTSRSFTRLWQATK
jgi:hypothetical protein